MYISSVYNNSAIMCLAVLANKLRAADTVLRRNVKFSCGFGLFFSNLETTVDSTKYAPLPPRVVNGIVC